MPPRDKKDVWDLPAPSLTQVADGKPDRDVDFILRSGLNVSAAPEARWRPLAEGTVTAFTDALNASPLHPVLEELSLAGEATGPVNPFHREGVNRSNVVRLAWSGAPHYWLPGRPETVQATVRLEVPGSDRRQVTHLRVETDVVVRRGTADKVKQQVLTGPETPFHRWRMPPRKLGVLINAILATLTSPGIVARLADLSGVDPSAVPQPRVMYMATEEPVTRILDAAGLDQIPFAGHSRGAHLLGDPALDLADDKDRSEQVRRWLIQIALDGGLTGMEKLLAGQGDQAVPRASDRPGG